MVALPLLAGLVMALAGLATGAALIVFFVARVSLPLALALVASVIAGVTTFTWRRLTIEGRRVFRRRAYVGVLSGVLALIAYDLSRLAVVHLSGLTIRPFAAIPLFGQLLLGTDSSTPLSDVLGMAYHAANGVGFGIAYTIVAGERGTWAGIVWGLALEGLMLTFYPGWLDIRAMNEFTTVSVCGHIAYGSMLGWSARRLLMPS